MSVGTAKRRVDIEKRLDVVVPGRNLRRRLEGVAGHAGVLVRDRDAASRTESANVLAPERNPCGPGRESGLRVAVAGDDGEGPADGGHLEAQLGDLACGLLGERDLETKLGPFPDGPATPGRDTNGNDE